MVYTTHSWKNWGWSIIGFTDITHLKPSWFNTGSSSRSKRMRRRNSWRVFQDWCYQQHGKSFVQKLSRFSILCLAAVFVGNFRFYMILYVTFSNIPKMVSPCGGSWAKPGYCQILLWFKVSKINDVSHFETTAKSKRFTLFNTFKRYFDYWHVFPIGHDFFVYLFKAFNLQVDPLRVENDSGFETEANSTQRLVLHMFTKSCCSYMCLVLFNIQIMYSIVQ